MIIMNQGSKHIKIERMQFEEILKENDLLRKASKIQYFAQQSRLDTFEMIYKRGNGHWGGSSSASEIITTLYSHIMNIDPSDAVKPDRDRFILSKGHAAPILYVILANRGFFPVKELSTFRELDSRLQGHPSLKATPGVDFSTGPLGHGVSVGLGIALGARLQHKNLWTFVLSGEGCLNEGLSWEGIMAAGKFKPQRLVIMIDYNKVQLDGTSNDIMPLEPLKEKFRAFNMNVPETIYDGHQVSEILKSWEWMQQNQDKPSVVIYRTHKGKGVSFMEDNNKWHGSTIDDESYLKGKTELMKTLEELSI